MQKVMGLAAALAMAWTNGFSQEKTADKYWKDIGYSFDKVEAKLTEEICSSSLESFLGCVYAVNEVLDFYPNKDKKNPKIVTLIPAFRVADTERFKGMVVSFGEVQIAEVRSVDLSNVLKAQKSFVAEKQKMYEGWKKAYGQFHSSGKKLEITAVVSWLKAHVLSAEANKELQSYIAGNAMNAFIQFTLDDHARFDPQQALLDQQSSTGERFYGVGMRMTQYIQKGGTLSPVKIVHVIAKGPAAGKGVRAGDEITQVKSVSGEWIKVTQSQIASDHIRGKEGTLAEFKIKRNGVETIVSATRAPIFSPNVDYELRTIGSESVAYIDIRTFMSDSTCAETQGKVWMAQQEHASALIVDVRGNPGGLMSQGICVSGIFLGKERPVVISKSVGENPQTTIHTNLGNPALKTMETALPLIVLVDAGSASASEIFSGAIQDHARGIILGERSFGKGTVQSLLPMGEGLILRMTTARFYLPSGRTNQVAGIIPDMTRYVRPTQGLDPSEVDDIAFHLREKDQFFRPLPFEGADWVLPPVRAKTMKQYEECMKATGSADARFSAQTDPVRLDYQLFAAEDLAKCMAPAKRMSMRSELRQSDRNHLRFASR
jgi:C-terminal peptidase prc